MFNFIILFWRFLFYFFYFRSKSLIIFLLCHFLYNLFIYKFILLFIIDKFISYLILDRSFSWLIVLFRYFFKFCINHFNYVFSCKLVLIIELFIFLIWLLNIINVLFSYFNIINLFIFLKIRQNSEVKQISFPLILNLTYI